jgi:hypothetical protein
MAEDSAQVDHYEMADVIDLVESEGSSVTFSEPDMNQQVLVTSETNFVTRFTCFVIANRSPVWGGSGGCG